MSVHPAPEPRRERPVERSSLLTNLRNRFRRLRNLVVARLFRRYQAASSDGLMRALRRTAYGDPPRHFPHSFDQLVPMDYPKLSSGVRRSFSQLQESELREDEFRATIWAHAIGEQVLEDPAFKAQWTEFGLMEVTVGFFTAHDRVVLGVIVYRQSPHLFAPRPATITVSGQNFPVAVRATTRHAHGSGGTSHDAKDCRFAIGVAAAHVTTTNGQQRWGILTPCHVAAGDTENFHRLQAGDNVQVRQGGQVLSRQVLRADPRLDAAVVECASQALPGKPWGITDYAAFVGVRAMFPGGPVDGRVVEIPLPQGVIPHGRGGMPPSLPAVLYLNFSGSGGDSGALVYDMSRERSVGPIPYGMYLGATEAYTGTLGRCLMFEQLRMYWQVEFFD